MLSEVKLDEPKSRTQIAEESVLGIHVPIQKPADNLIVERVWNEKRRICLRKRR